jgi:hypothetical protein
VETASAPQLWDEEATFRPIHYLGNKLRLLDLIVEAVSAVALPSGRYLDLFCGSGVVARQFASDAPVTAVDIQEFARVVTSALLSPSRERMDDVRASVARQFESQAAASLLAAVGPLLEHEDDVSTRCDAEAIAEIVELGSLAIGEDAPRTRAFARATRDVVASVRRIGNVPSPLVRHYGGTYFSYRQAVELDLLCALAHRAVPADRDTWIAALLGAASDCVTSVGNQFAQPLAVRDARGVPKPHAIEVIQRKRKLRPVDRFLRWMARYTPHESRFEHEVRREDYRDFLGSFHRQVAVTYADPPYTRDHYSRFYHVLETIALGDDPTLGRWGREPSRQVSRGLYRHGRHQSPFCIKSQAPAAFEQLIGGARRFGAPLIVSYSPYSDRQPAHPRMLTISELVLIAKKHFAQTKLLTADDLTHSKMNASHRNFAVSSGAEVLLVCLP